MENYLTSQNVGKRTSSIHVRICNYVIFAYPHGRMPYGPNLVWGGAQYSLPEQAN